MKRPFSVQEPKRIVEDTRFKGRRFAIGDIHGCHKALLECLEAVNFDYDNDLLVSLGDLVDRGLESYNVAETLMKIKHKVLIQGNHDMWFKDHLLFGKPGRYSSDSQSWMMQGGHETVHSYLVHGGMNAATYDFKRKAEHQAFYKSQVPYFVLDNAILFVHGGFDRRFPIASQDPVSLCWDREFVQEMMSCTGGQRLKIHDGFPLVFIGHTPTTYWKVDTPIFRGGVWNIDTGCGKGGKLTIMNINTQEYYQTKEGHYK
jgi:serine/threonine protein phosphatase 1